MVSHHKIYGRRMRGGGTLIGPQAAQFGFVALYNDSTIGHILRVIHWQAGNGAGTNGAAFLTQGTVGTLVNQGIALFSGEQAMAGSIYSGTDANAPPFGLLLPTLGSLVQAPELRPWFYLRPGYSLVFKAITINISLAASMIWEDLEMSMLQHEELE